MESAHNWPELAHLQLPTYLAVLVGLVPVVVAVKRVFDLVSVVERGEAFSTRTVQTLQQLRLLSAWGVLELTALFVLTLAALLERLFRDALELRQDQELTV